MASFSLFLIKILLSTVLLVPLVLYKIEEAVMVCAGADCCLTEQSIE